MSFFIFHLSHVYVFFPLQSIDCYFVQHQTEVTQLSLSGGYCRSTVGTDLGVGWLFLFLLYLVTVGGAKELYLINHALYFQLVNTNFSAMCHNMGKLYVYVSYKKKCESVKSKSWKWTPFWLGFNSINRISMQRPHLNSCLYANQRLVYYSNENRARMVMICFTLIHNCVEDYFFPTSVQC